MEEERKSYEIAFLLRSLEGIGALVKHLNNLGAEIISEGEVKELKLTYPIKHLNSAYFGYVHFNFQPDSIAGLNETLKLQEGILRFLIITPPFTKNRSERLQGGPIKPERKPILPPVTPLSESGTEISNDALEAKLEEILNK